MLELNMCSFKGAKIISILVPMIFMFFWFCCTIIYVDLRYICILSIFFLSFFSLFRFFFHLCCKIVGLRFILMHSHTEWMYIKDKRYNHFYSMFRERKKKQQYRWYDIWFIGLTCVWFVLLNAWVYKPFFHSLTTTLSHQHTRIFMEMIDVYLASCYFFEIFRFTNLFEGDHEILSKFVEIT